jgi:F-type H+-transporting ATPase subunit a
MEPVGGHIFVDFSITRQILFVFVSALVLLIIGLRLAGRYKRGIGRDEAPRGVWQNAMEVIIAFIRDDVAKAAIGPTYRKYVPYMLTLFFFILLGNLLGLVPWGVTATSNIMVTGSLALLTFIITQFSGSKDYWRHIFWPPDVAIPIKFILIPVEFIGIFTKPLALAFRLFGNMISGHLAIVSILGLIFITTASINAYVGSVFVVFSVALTIFIYLLKIFVSFVQAYIFVMLSSVFIGLAAAEHHQDDHAHGHDAHEHPVSHPLPEHEEDPLGASASAGNGSLTPEPSLAKI